MVTNWRWMLLLLPITVLAAEQTVLVNTVLDMVLMFIGVQFVCACGHAAASLTEWANWRDVSGTPVEVAARRLGLIRGFMASMLAGNALFYGGTGFAGLAEIPGIFGAGVAAYGGDKVIKPILDRITGK